MCRRVTCKKCHKASWAGCGAHVEQVLGGVPKADRCQCDALTASAKAGAKTGAKTGGSWLGRLLGR